MWIIKAISECGTYKETLRCVSEAEANSYAVALRADGWSVTIKQP